MLSTTAKMGNTLPDQTATPTAKMEQKELHQSAPRHLKEAFKLCKQTTYTATEDSPSITGMINLETLPIEARNIAFQDFMTAAPLNTSQKRCSTGSLNHELPLSRSQLEGSSYGSGIIPGRITAFLSSNTYANDKKPSPSKRFHLVKRLKCSHFFAPQKSYIQKTSPFFFLYYFP